MPGRSRVLLALVFFAGLLSAPPARASFGDCNSPDYLKLFDERFKGQNGFLCVESDRVPVTSDAGTTHIRIVQHLVSDWAARPGALQAIKSGVAGSIRAMGTLGHFRISDVTILIVDSFAPGKNKEDFDAIAAWASFAPGDECRITVWLLAAGATADYGAAVISHELFHCVQRSSLSRGQLDSGGGGVAGGGGWWMEGSADWFSTVAARAPRYMSGRVSMFDDRSPNLALNAMAYEAYAFFAWLGGVKTRVMPFLSQMAASSAESAQRAAMAAALPGEQWLRFAEDYIDQRIVDGHGASIGSSPNPGETLEWRATETKRMQLAPFVLKRASLAVRCGRWSLRGTPAQHHAARADESGRPWGALPDSIDALDGGSHRFRFAGLATTPSRVALQIAGTQQARCEECAGTREIDRCLVGTWRMTADGAERWMRENIHKATVTYVSQVGSTLTLERNGTFATGASQVRVGLQGTGGTSGTGALSGQASGRWSASGGHLNMCPDASAMSGTITVTTRGRTVQVPHPARSMPPSSREYACTAASFTLKTQMPRGTAVVSTYQKVSEPPP